ncbi:hypothetical protein pb186bvf_007827 [Paramecium bursaria]
MDQDEDQSPIHIKRELDINIPKNLIFPFSPNKDTPRTAILVTNDNEEITTPKTQVDMSSPRLPFLTHSQIVGISNDDEDLVYSASQLSKLNAIREMTEEQTPSLHSSQVDQPSPEFHIENLSMANSQQLKFSKKASSERDSVINRLELENSKLREEHKEIQKLMEQRIYELEQENSLLMKKINQEKFKQIELQMELDYKIQTISEQLVEKDEYYQRTIQNLKNNSQISQKVTQLIKYYEPQFETQNKDIQELLQILNMKIRQYNDAEEKIDEHRDIINSLKQELNEVKNLRGQLSKIYIDFDWNAKKNQDSQEQKFNELNLQILALKAEKLDLYEINQKLQNQLVQKDGQLQEIQKSNTSLDTLRKSSFFKTLQSSTLQGELKMIKDSLKQKHDHLKRKNVKSQNSPQSRSHNPSPTLKFLHSPKNSQNSPNVENKSIYGQNTSDFMQYMKQDPQNDTYVQRFVEQFRGNTSFAQKLLSYQKKN